MLTPINKPKTKAVMREDSPPPSVGSLVPPIRSKSPLILPFVGQPCAFLYHKGLTLFELMTVLAIVGILLGVAVPNISTFVQNNRIVTQTNDLIADLSFARSEAIRRTANVTVCKLARNVTPPACSTAGTNWAGGWAVFIDADKGGDIDVGEDVIRIHEALPHANATLTASANLANSFIYSRLGVTNLPAAGSWTLCDERRDPAFGRIIALETTGRASIQKKPPTC